MHILFIRKISEVNSAFLREEFNLQNLYAKKEDILSKNWSVFTNSNVYIVYRMHKNITIYLVNKIIEKHFSQNTK